MATTQALTLTQVSQDVANNKSTVHIVWTTTQTGSSYNNVEKTGYYWVSVNGGTETKYTVYSTLPYQSTRTIVDTDIQVTHNASGECTVAVRTEMDTAISAGVIRLTKSLKLNTIPRASTITSAGNVTLGEKCNVKWTPLSASFRYRLRFSIGDWYDDTGMIHPNQTTAYTYTGHIISLDAAEEITNKTTGEMTVYLFTYSDSSGKNQIGSTSSKEITVTVPTSTKPTVSFESVRPVHSLPEAFNGIYVQGYSKVEAKMKADPKYGAGISYYDFTVEGKTYGATNSYTSAPIAGSGEISVVGHAVDTRSYGGYTPAWKINVIPYTKPDVKNVTVQRCDALENPDDYGTYLKIYAKRSYSKVESNGYQKNYCSIRYRYKSENGSYPDQWTTILFGENTNTDDVSVVIGGTLKSDTTYFVQVGVIDTVGNTAHTTVTIPTDKVYCHRDGARRSFTFGGYVNEDNTFKIASDIAFKPMGGIAMINQYDGLDFNALKYYTGYYASSSAPSSTGSLNYPVNKTGVLEVISRMVINKDTGASWGFAWQTYRTYEGEIYTRSYYSDYSGTGWTDWKKIQMA